MNQACRLALQNAAASLLLALAIDAIASPLVLVTPEEAAAHAAEASAPWFTPKAGPGAPVIDVVAPDLGGGRLASPLAIELRFRAAADARIDPASFRVFYGAFKLDITDRLLKAVQVTPLGLRIEQAAIPAGSHRLVVQVADDRARISTKDLRFSVD